jgi:hypothetical protein
MKEETKVKKLILKKVTLRDLTARHAEEIKGGSCSLHTSTGIACPTYKCHGQTWNKRCTR